jgi:hypothetical protein
MPVQPPGIDRADFAEIRREVLRAMQQLVPAWQPPAGSDPAMALVAVFAHYMELLLARLNRVPEKNLVAFLDMLGVGRLTPGAARALVVFTPGPAAGASTLVPAGTQVATLQTETAPAVIYETGEDLNVVQSRLIASKTIEPGKTDHGRRALDRYADQSTLVQNGLHLVSRPFRGDTVSEHALYLGIPEELPLLARKRGELSVLFETYSVDDLPAFKLAMDNLRFSWEVRRGETWEKLEGAPAPQKLTDASKTFKVTWGSGSISAVSGPEPAPLAGLGLEKALIRRWLRASITAESWLIDSLFLAKPEEGVKRIALRASFPPGVTRENFQAGSGIPPDAGTLNLSPIDVSKPFPLFGPQPKPGDAFYMASREVFAQKGALVFVYLDITQQGIVTPGVSVDDPAGKQPPSFRLRWQYHSELGWQTVGTTEVGFKFDTVPDAGTDHHYPVSPPTFVPAAPAFADGTLEFVKAHDGQPDQVVHHSGTVSFKLPTDIPPTETELAGQSSYWVRVLLASGDYGRPPEFKLVDKNLVQKHDTGNLSPPFVASISLGYRYDADIPGVALVTQNGPRFDDRTHENGSLGEAIFRVTTDEKPTWYLGFDRPLPNSEVTLFHSAPVQQFVQDFRRPMQDLIRRVTSTAGPVDLRLLTDGDLSTGVELAPTTGSPTAFLRLEFAEPFEAQTLFHTSSPAASDGGASGGSGPASPMSLEASDDGGEFRKICDVPVGVGDESGMPTTVRFPATRARFFRLVTTQARRIVEIWLSGAVRIPIGAFREDQRPAAGGGEKPNLTWEYWTGSKWMNLVPTSDQTRGLRESGVVQFVGPINMAAASIFDSMARYWIRVRLEEEDYQPILDGVYLNAVEAVQVSTERELLLGSSNGQKNQLFQFPKVPVLEGQQVWVREPERPSSEEINEIQAETDQEIVRMRRSGDGTDEIWVRWEEAGTLRGSDARGRQYVLDHAAGALQFGDGVNGMIPPAGRDNIAARQVQTGGGVSGNQPAAAINQVKSSLPLIAAVSNPGAADGGSQPEAPTAVLERGPQTVRHRGRAVTAEDYEWLARQAVGTRVARARCLANRNQSLGFEPGAVTLVIVPEGQEKKLLPSPRLIQEVEEHISQRNLPRFLSLSLVNLNVIGAGYVPVELEAEIVPRTLAQAEAVRADVVALFDRFFHPLTGGPERTGWPFGRDVYLSELYAELEALPGIEHVRDLRFRPGAAAMPLRLEPLFTATANYQALRRPEQASSTDRSVVATVTEPIVKGQSISEVMVLLFQEGEQVTVGEGIRARQLRVRAISGNMLIVDPFRVPMTGIHAGATVAASVGPSSTYLVEKLSPGSVVTQLQVAPLLPDEVVTRLTMISVTSGESQELTVQREKVRGNGDRYTMGSRLHIPDFCLPYSGSHAVVIVAENVI